MTAPEVTATDERAAVARTVADTARTRLLTACRANHDDGRFQSGASYAVAALDRVLAALDGETDPARLGLAEMDTGVVHLCMWRAAEPDLVGGAG